MKKTKVFVIYDSLYGNTEKTAKAISASLKNSKLLHIGNVNPEDLKKADLIVFGSPTQGGNATSDIRYFLSLPELDLKGLKVAVFDTRLDERDMNFILRMMIGKLSFAAPKMAEALKNKGAVLVKKPKGFFVTGKVGPLKSGELQKAELWLKNYGR
jgi:flavodoxin